MATSTQEWIEELKGISVADLAERIKALEEEFGVSATAVAAAAPAAAGGGDAAAEDEGPSTVDVVLTAPGDKKIQVIKVVRAATGLGPEGDQGGPRARRGREAQGRARGGRRKRRAQVAPAIPCGTRRAALRRRPFAWEIVWWPDDRSAVKLPPGS
jgi:ribosomal protein L7/L12